MVVFRKTRNIPFSLRLVLALMLASLVSARVCTYFYEASARRAVDIQGFQSELNEKEKQAEKVVDELKSIIVRTSVDSVTFYHFGNDDISHYIFDQHNNLIFWSDNHLDISKVPLADTTTNWRYSLLSNAHCINKVTKVDSVRILSIINIKNNFPYENDELTNNFSPGFKPDKQVQIQAGERTDSLAVFSPEGGYLFSLSAPPIPIYNELWSAIGLIMYAITCILFFILYARSSFIIGRKYINTGTFLVISLSVGIATGLCVYFNIPSLLFWNKLFTPFQYASNHFLASIVHLSIVTIYFLSTIYLFYFHVNTAGMKSLKSRLALQLIFASYFIGVYYVLSGLVYHSSIQLSILQFKDFSFLITWIHFLVLLWGIGLALLFYKTHNISGKYFSLRNRILIDLFFSILVYAGSSILSPDDTNRVSTWFPIFCLVFYLPLATRKIRSIYSYMFWWVVVFTAFVVCNSISISNLSKYNKFRILAQNISINGNTENDRMAEILLDELDLKLLKDRKIKRLVAIGDSLPIANVYLNNTYLRGFWNKYEMRLNVAAKGQETYQEYSKFISDAGSRIKNTHFYSVPANEKNMSYIGAFPVAVNTRDSLFFYMEFYPRRNFKSYSFPNLLIASSPEIQRQLNIGIAKYEHHRLVFSSGKMEYAANENWIPKERTEFFKVNYKNHIHYIYKPNPNTSIIITDLAPYDPAKYLLYFAYTFLAYFSLCWLIVRTFFIIRKKKNYRIGLTAKFQLAFISLLIISFISIFYVSVNFIEKKYQQEQIANLENKKTYIQKALQDMYYWNQDLNTMNTQNLNFDLQDLSYIYHTDIHAFNNEGVLIGSSQPLIFNKSLISNRISPKPYFSLNANINQYEHIGKLDYLTGYTDFYNGDYLQIGYIAIPQFFSQDEIRSEIESFLSVIIHIYLIIIILAILLSLFIGKQLSAPLIMIENKLREMRLGQRNEKIDYTLNDEIGQLVSQYNRTVGELEQSARLLAKSERESAWKTMARQVAHEINNPLTPMKLTIQQLQRTKKMNDAGFDDYFAKSTAMLVEQINNLSRIAGTFSNFARMPEAKFEQVDVAAKLFSVVQLFVNNNEQVRIEYSGNEDNVFVYADPEQLVQVFNNLLKNAIQAIPSEREGEIKIKLSTIDNQVIINISDNGSGIGPEIRDKLFMPDFTTKSTGMGLGLAISKNIVELSGGTITFSTELNHGTTFTVRLPQAG
ncbi:MAG TPA: ATP-binding protein [Paludibacter sp.]|nr:ATP-binding protein [Paludibacter sp.]